MIDSKTLSLFLLKNEWSRVCNHNISFIQKSMHSNNPSRIKFRFICKDLPNLTILTKITASGEVQLKFYQTAIINKSSGE